MSNRLILALENISLTFGGKPLFEGLNFHLAEHDRISLVGKNGAGKTTLMRLMSEDLALDGGKRFVYPGVSIGYLAQQVAFVPDHSVRQFVLSGLPKEARDEHNEYLADIVIGPLGLEADALMRTLSGGQIRRASLAQTLVSDPDILLLDEPTNHLDLSIIEWLEEYLASYRGAIVCVSHDRRFLANVSRKVCWIDRGQIKVCPFGYDQFEDWLEEYVALEARAMQNLQKKVEAEHDWTQGGVTGRRKRNARRLRELYVLRDKLSAQKAAMKERRQKIELDALESPNASKIVAEFKGVSKSFVREDGRKIPILNEFHHLILKGDRIGILGHNGSGKSSFLKLLTAELQPDAGRIFRSKTIDISYFDQHRSMLNPAKTLWETLCPDGGQNVLIGAGENQRQMHVCGYLKQFLFDPKAVNDKVATLSGGQQNRLLLAKILSQPGNVLILDEPTNDLDMDTLDMLQDMLADYEGTLIIVSHDRDFLDRSVTEVLAFEGNAEVFSVVGGYSDYVREKQARSNIGKAVTKKTSPPIAPPATAQTAEEPAQPTGKKLTYGERLELQKLPAKMADTQAQILSLKEQLNDTGIYQRDPDGFSKMLKDFQEAEASLGRYEARWLELEERNA